MTKKLKPNKLANQMTLAMDATEGEPLDIGEPHPRLKPGCMLAEFIEMDPPHWTNLLFRSEILSKDSRSTADVAFIKALHRDIEDNNYLNNCDAIIVDKSLRIIQGIKRAIAGSQSTNTIRILFIMVDTEARFFTGRPRRNNSKDHGVLPEPGTCPAVPLDMALAGLTAGQSAVVREAIGIRDGIATSLDHDITRHWTVQGLAESLETSSPLVRIGVPAPLAVFIHQCLADVMPLHADAFLRAMADPSIAPRSAPARLASSIASGVASVDDETEILTLFAFAAEAFVTGKNADPVRLKMKSNRTETQMLHVLVGANGRKADRLTSVALEVIAWSEIPALLAATGTSCEKIRKSAPNYLDGMVRDVRRERGLFPTGETIKISAGGKVLDGLYRLAACYEARCDAVCHVARGFREDFKHALPRLRPSSMGHFLYAEGYPSPYDHSAVLQVIYCLTENIRGITATTPHLRHLWGQHAQLTQSVVFVHPLKINKPWIHLSLKPKKNQWDIPKNIMGAAHLMMTRFSHQLADLFILELIDVLNEGPDFKPIHDRHQTVKLLADRLRLVYIEERDNTISDDEILCNVIETMNAWCPEEALERFSPMPSEGYPSLRQPDQVTKLQKELKAEAEKAFT